jgi:hypothetical protein
VYRDCGLLICSLPSAGEAAPIFPDVCSAHLDKKCGGHELFNPSMLTAVPEGPADSS